MTPIQKLRLAAMAMVGMCTGPELTAFRETLAGMPDGEDKTLALQMVDALIETWAVDEIAVMGPDGKLPAPVDTRPYPDHITVAATGTNPVWLFAATLSTNPEHRPGTYIAVDCVAPAHRIKEVDEILSGVMHVNLETGSEAMDQVERAREILAMIPQPRDAADRDVPIVICDECMEVKLAKAKSEGHELPLLIADALTECAGHVDGDLRSNMLIGAACIKKLLQETNEVRQLEGRDTLPDLVIFPEGDPIHNAPGEYTPWEKRVWRRGYLQGRDNG